MTKKEILQKLLKEGKTVQPGTTDYDVWKEKVNSGVREAYGNDSEEYKEIRNIGRKLVFTEESQQDKLKEEQKNYEKRMNKLEAWEDLL